MIGKSILYKLLVLLLCGVILSSCGRTAQQGDSASQASENGAADEISSSVTMDMASFESDDYYSGWEEENPSYIELTGSGANVKGTGASAEGSKVTITAAGVYAVSGKLDNGQIIVDVQDKGTVKLVLNGAEINCADNPPVYVKNAGKAIISLQQGTQNVLSDGENYVLEDPSEDGPNAALFSKCNLTINGTGALTVNGNYNNGITARDDLKITGGSINVNSMDDALMGRDMVAIKEGSITIKAGGDGIKSTNDTDTSKGFVAIQGGSFSIISDADGIQAVTSVLVSGGEFTIMTGGGSINSSDKAGSSGPWAKNQDSTAAQQSEAGSSSAKAVKSSCDIAISGGIFSIDSSDDAFHSNNSILISAGDISIASGDDGIHADYAVAVKGGKVDIAKSYEGIEGSTVTVSGGDIFVVSKDDGINVAGGNDGSSLNGRPGQNSFAASPDCKLNIDGGYISVDASGDGLDSNGSIYMTSGTVVVNGPMNSGNGALDYNGSFENSGGFLVAAGSSGMAEPPSEQSAQYSVMMSYTSMQQAGTLVHLEDEDGNTIATFAPKKEYQSVVISSPELKKDKGYTLYSAGSSTGDNEDGLYTGGEYQGGTKIVGFNISNVITWLTEDGVTAGRSPNQGGPGSPGFGGGKGQRTK